MTKFIPLESLYSSLPESTKNHISPETGGFNIIKVEDLLVDGRAVQNGYSKRSFFKISLVAGHCIIHYADRSITVKNYALVFTNPLVPYKWEIVSKVQKGYVCVFTEDFFPVNSKIKEYPVFTSADQAIILLDEEQYNNFCNHLKRMQEELRSDYSYKYDYLRNLVLEIIQEAQKQNPEKGETVGASNASERIFLLFSDLLERQFNIKDIHDAITLRTASDYAERLSLHINHLNKALKIHTAQTTSSLISKRLITEARLLLRTSNWTIAEISRCLGFAEPNHFSSFFKSKTKVSPNTFRKKMIEI